jgi:hypothetical protein
MMNLIISAVFCVVGLLGIFKADFFYRKALLSPEQIQRNNRIWRIVGSGLIVASATLLGLTLGPHRW